MEEITLLSVTDAAKAAKVSRPTIYAWMRSGKIPVYFSGFRSRFKQNKVGWISPKDISEIIGRSVN